MAKQSSELLVTMRRAALVTAILMMFLLIEPMALVKLANANPIPYPKAPSTELPTLILADPVSNSDDYSNNLLKVNFSVIEPESWKTHYKFIATVGSWDLDLYLDGILQQRRNETLRLQVFPASNGLQIDYTAVLSNLTETGHVFRIDVTAKAYYEAQFLVNNEVITSAKSNNTYISQAISFQLNPNSKTVTFQKSAQSVSAEPIPNPTPTTPELITGTLYLPSDRNAPHLDPIFYLLPISAILAIAVIAIVIFRRKTNR